MGRRAPFEPLSRAQVERMARVGCGMEEILRWHGVSQGALEAFCRQEWGRSAADVLAHYDAVGRLTLREAEFAQLQKSATMAVFLAKALLGQRADGPVQDAGMEGTAAIFREFDALLEAPEEDRPLPD